MTIFKVADRLSIRFDELDLSEVDMERAVRGLSEALNRLKSLSPEWAIELSDPQADYGDNWFAYQPEISYRSPSGLEVKMELHTFADDDSRVARIAISQSYGDGSPSENVFSGSYYSSAPRDEAEFSLLFHFILSVTASAISARAQRCIEARRAFFDSE